MLILWGGTESEMWVGLRQDKMSGELPDRQALLPEGQRRARPAPGGLSVAWDLSLMLAATWSPQLPPPQNNQLPPRGLCRSILKWVQWKGLPSNSDKGALGLPSIVPLGLHLPRSFFLKFIYPGRVGRSLKFVQRYL